MAAISEAMGRPPMPHQRLVWDVALEVQSEAAGDPEPGAWAYDDVRWYVQRQAGKTTGLRPVIVHRCGSRPGVRAFMTAQKRDKARARWLDATSDILTSRLADGVRRKIGVGHEELRWSNESTFVPFAPNEEDMHGESPDLVAIDEQWAFDEIQAKALTGAYVPGFTTKDGQAWKFSTAGTPRSWWFNTERRTGRAAVEAGTRLGVAYFEWGLPDLVGGRPLDDLSDAELVQACIDHHPATGYILRPAAVWSAWNTMGGDRAGFLRAYGNRTAADDAVGWVAIDEGVWLRAASPARIPEGAPVGLAFDVDPDRRDAAVIAGSRVGGRMLTEVVRHDLGTRWVAPFVAGLVERQRPVRVAVNDAGPARDVADELERAGVELLRVGASDCAAACQRHLDELMAGTWVHDNHPKLTEAAEAAGWRRVNLSRAWASATGEPITALAGTTLAGWAFDHPAPVDEPLPRFWMG